MSPTPTIPWPTITLSVVALIAWLLLHRFHGPQTGRLARAMFLIRTAVGATACWLGLELASRVLILEGGWIRTGVAIGLALSWEMIVALYAAQRKTVRPRTSRMLLRLRLGLVALLLLALLQPVFAYRTKVRHERYLAVLVDDSASMRLADPQSTAGEKLQLARLYGLSAAQKVPPAEKAEGQSEQQRRQAEAQAAETWFTGLDSATAQEVNLLRHKSRGAVAREVLLSETEGDRSILEELGQSREVALYRFASTPKLTTREQLQADDTDIASDDPLTSTIPAKVRQWRQATDLAGALGMIQQKIPADRLAGVLIVSDGRHNRGAPAEPIARQLGQQGVPICSVVVGSTVPRPGAAITDVYGPEAAFLDDRITESVWVKTTGLKGRSLKVRMFQGKEQVDEQSIAVPEDRFRTRVALSHKPASLGIHSYRIELETPEGDLIKSNKVVERHVTVTDARIKLLVVDDRPRWEYRYLRNLFAGRDKTVQLQAMLLRPDSLVEGPERPRVPASAARAFGEFEATALPASPEEWLNFEVIVLGDLPPSVLDKTAIQTLKTFVAKQGGTLVVIAGPNAMPHAYAGTELAELMPATFAASERPLFTNPEPAYRWALTPEGDTHMMMRQRANPTESNAVWNSLPSMDWRHPVEQIKPGATVLAYAVPLSAEEAADPAAPSPVNRLSDTERMQLQRQNPLVVMHRFGAGNVLLMCSDRTWRLRYRVGDTNHHQFWGQVLRWATANKLAAGTAHVRLGTDRSRYQPGDPVTVRAQLLDENSTPITGSRLVARVWQGDKQVLSRTLAFVPDSRGLYQGDLGVLPAAGKYRVELTGPDVERLLALDQAKAAKTEILISAAEETSELVESTADWNLPSQLAALSRGRAVGVAEARSLLDLFGAGSRETEEFKYISLWDGWPLVVLVLSAACGEWILRKKVGLP